MKVYRTSSSLKKNYTVWACNGFLEMYTSGSLENVATFLAKARITCFHSNSVGWGDRWDNCGIYGHHHRWKLVRRAAWEVACFSHRFHWVSACSQRHLCYSECSLSFWVIIGSGNVTFCSSRLWEYPWIVSSLNKALNRLPVLEAWYRLPIGTSQVQLEHFPIIPIPSSRQYVHATAWKARITFYFMHTIPPQKQASIMIFIISFRVFSQLRKRTIEVQSLQKTRPISQQWSLPSCISPRQTTCSYATYNSNSFLLVL